MSLHRFSSWFMTDTGKSVAHGSLLFANAVGILYHFVPHTIILQYYTDAVHLYENGEQVPVSAELQDKFEKCLEILKINEVGRKVIKPFRVCGFDVFNAGTSNTRFGAIIGIPTNFDYKSADDIDKENIRVNLKLVDWNTEEGKKLEEAIVLPEKVQLFAICREILQAETFKVYWNTLYGVGAFGFLYTTAMSCNNKFKLFTKPPMIRYTFYSIINLFALGLYFFAKDFTQVWIEKSIDKDLADLGPEFIDSGIVFYDKMLKRNQALRTLMGKEGISKYSVLGNENFFIRNVRVPVVRRKQYFEDRKKTLEEKSKISNKPEI